jgi:UDP-glucose 4-epimerase
MTRILVTGMGGELGTRVAQLLEEHDDVTEIAGCDLVPPRRRLRRSEFRRIDPRDQVKVTAFVDEFAPDAVIHYGVYEPDSRLGGREAAEASEACTVHVLSAAAKTGKLERVAVRSGLEVYGRGRGRPLVPAEDAPLAPTSPYGRTCLEVETMAATLVRRLGIPVAALRLAPVVGSHVPSPLGRLLRLPLVPVPALADPAFVLLHQEDAARAMVEAVRRDVDGPVNVVGRGAASPWQAARLGGRIPVPVLGRGWDAARRIAELAGAPVPPHVLELMCKGRAGDDSRARDVLALEGVRSTIEVCTELYEWGTVTPLRRGENAA